VVRWWNGRDLALCGHAVAETYSVLTRLPGDCDWPHMMQRGSSTSGFRCD
jgi:hypothetical protein